MTTPVLDPVYASVRPDSAPRFKGLILQPIIILLMIAFLVIWLTSSDLDRIEEVTLNQEFLTKAIIQHLQLTFAAAALILVVSIPLGIVLSRPWARPLTPVILALANTGQAFPAVGLVILAAITFGFGFTVAVVAFAAYGILPILRNTIVGLQGVDPAIVESAKGMGMTSGQALRKVELPLAVPVIMAGVRTTLILTVGVAVLGVFVNGGGLGTVIVPGLKLGRDTVLVSGTLLTAIIAFTIDWIARVVERFLRPRGT